MHEQLSVAKKEAPDKRERKSPVAEKIIKVPERLEGEPLRKALEAAATLFNQGNEDKLPPAVKKLIKAAHTERQSAGGRSRGGVPSIAGVVYERMRNESGGEKLEEGLMRLAAEGGSFDVAPSEDVAEAAVESAPASKSVKRAHLRLIRNDEPVADTRRTAFKPHGLEDLELPGAGDVEKLHQETAKRLAEIGDLESAEFGEGINETLDQMPRPRALGREKLKLEQMLTAGEQRTIDGLAKVIRTQTPSKRDDRLKKIIKELQSRVDTIGESGRSLSERLVDAARAWKKDAPALAAEELAKADTFLHHTEFDALDFDSLKKLDTKSKISDAELAKSVASAAYEQESQKHQILQRSLREAGWLDASFTDIEDIAAAEAFSKELAKSIPAGLEERLSAKNIEAKKQTFKELGPEAQEAIDELIQYHTTQFRTAGFEKVTEDLRERSRQEEEIELNDSDIEVVTDDQKEALEAAKTRGLTDALLEDVAHRLVLSPSRLPIRLDPGVILFSLSERGGRLDPNALEKTLAQYDRVLNELPKQYAHELKKVVADKMKKYERPVESARPEVPQYPERVILNVPPEKTASDEEKIGAIRDTIEQHGMPVEKLRGSIQQLQQQAEHARQALVSVLAEEKPDQKKIHDEQTRLENLNQELYQLGSRLQRAPSMRQEALTENWNTIQMVENLLRATHEDPKKALRELRRLSSHPSEHVLAVEDSIKEKYGAHPEALMHGKAEGFVGRINQWRFKRSPEAQQWLQHKQEADNIRRSPESLDREYHALQANPKEVARIIPEAAELWNRCVKHFKDSDPDEIDLEKAAKELQRMITLLAMQRRALNENNLETAKFYGGQAMFLAKEYDVENDPLFQQVESGTPSFETRGDETLESVDPALTARGIQKSVRGRDRNAATRQRRFKA